jgi:hypothetical protein
VDAELYEAQRSERGGRARGCGGLLKEKEQQCLEELSKCSNAYRPLLLKSLKLILELWQLAKVYEKDSPALPKEARDSLMAYVIPKARRLFIEIANVLKEKEGFDEDLLAEALVRTEL